MTCCCTSCSTSIVVSCEGSTVSPETNIIWWISSAFKSFSSSSTRMLSASCCVRPGILINLRTLKDQVVELMLWADSNQMKKVWGYGFDNVLWKKVTGEQWKSLRLSIISKQLQKSVVIQSEVVLFHGIYSGNAAVGKDIYDAEHTRIWRRI